jgi:hypothetical protein
MDQVKKLWQFTLVGLVEGVDLGWVLSLISGSYFVITMIAALGTIIGIVLGIIHRNDA